MYVATDMAVLWVTSYYMNSYVSTTILYIAQAIAVWSHSKPAAILKMKIGDVTALNDAYM